MNSTSASQAERDADRLRDQLAETIDQLVEKLTPKQLASEVVNASLESLRRYWSFVRTPERLAVVCGVAALSLLVGIMRKTARRQSHQHAIDDFRQRGP